jgi:uncharacterized protein
VIKVQDLLIEHGESIVLFAFLAICSLWIGKSFGYFRLPENREAAGPKISLLQVVSLFAIYLGTMVIIGGGVAKYLLLFSSYFLNEETIHSPYYRPLISSFIQLITSFTAALFIFLFCRAQKDRASMFSIWKEHGSRTPIITDIGFGLLSWIISFPVVLFVGELFEFLIFVLFGPQQYEQVAVHYLKMSLSSSFVFAIAIFTVVIAAPVLEELLFRGFLLNFLKRYLGRMGAILVTSIAFALFHFSVSQNLGNIPLVASLFTLALFLGFIYERQRSLFASISLHMTFNIISVLRILLDS